MPVSHRKLLLAAAFLGLAFTLSDWKPLRAQQPPFPVPLQPSPRGPQSGIDSNITPDQVRAAFLRGRVGLSPDLEKLVPGLSEEFKKQFPSIPPNVAEPAIRRLLDDPNLQSFSPQMREEIIRKAITDPKYKKQIEEGIAKGRRENSINGNPPQLPSDMARSIPDLSKAPNVVPQPNVGPTPTSPKIDPGTVPNIGEKPAGPGTKTSPMNPPTTTKSEPPIPPSMTGKTAQPLPQKNPKTDPPPSRTDIQEKPPEQKGNPLGDAFKNPADLAKEAPQDAGRNKARQAVATLWERNVGPLEETPELKRALFDFVDGTGDLNDGSGNNFWDTLTKDTGDGSSFTDWLDKSSGGDWKIGGWEWPSMGWGRNDGSRPGGDDSSSSGGSWWSRRGSSSSSSSRGGSGGGGFNIGIPGLEGTWLPVVILAAVLLGGLLLWKFLYFRDPKQAQAFDLSGLGPWPVDPRSIATREDLVKAFEYLSVMICGPAARMWTHLTIASALMDLATTDSEAAIILARLYELARYAPLDEPLSPAEIEESRRLVCRLAGVSYP